MALRRVNRVFFPYPPPMFQSLVHDRLDLSGLDPDV
jgi:hypothetical protein